MIARRRVDQLNIHPETIIATLHRAFNRVANIQLTTNLPDIDRFAFVGERGVLADDK